MGRKNGFFKVIVLCLVFFAFVAQEAFVQEQEQVAVIYRINGKLEIRSQEDTEWEPAQKGPLYIGNQLRTGTGDKAMIIYNTGTRVLINENTTIEIQAEVEVAGGKPTMERTKLIIGEIYNRVQGNYEVETPSSVASVRGTEFNTLSTLDQDTYVGIEGVVEIMNEFGSVILRQLQLASVQRGQAPEEPNPISEGDANDLISWTEGVEPYWRLNIIPERGTDQQLNSSFNLTIQATREGSIDPNATFALTEFSVDSPAIEFSVDDGRTWNAQPPAVTLINGQAALLGRITEEATVNITAIAEDAESAFLSITVSRPKETRTIEMIFTDPDGGGEKTLIWELEEK